MIFHQSSHALCDYAILREPFEQHGSVQQGFPLDPPLVHGCHISLDLNITYGGKITPAEEPQTIIEVADFEHAQNI